MQVQPKGVIDTYKSRKARRPTLIPVKRYSCTAHMKLIDVTPSNPNPLVATCQVKTQPAKRRAADAKAFQSNNVTLNESKAFVRSRWFRISFNSGGIQTAHDTGIQLIEGRTSS